MTWTDQELLEHCFLNHDMTLAYFKEEDIHDPPRDADDEFAMLQQGNQLDGSKKIYDRRHLLVRLPGDASLLTPTDVEALRDALKEHGEHEQLDKVETNDGHSVNLMRSHGTLPGFEAIITEPIRFEFFWVSWERENDGVVNANGHSMSDLETAKELFEEKVSRFGGRYEEGADAELEEPAEE